MKNGNTKHVVGTITDVRTLGLNVHEITVKGEGKENGDEIKLTLTGRDTWTANAMKGSRVRASYLYGTSQCVGVGGLPEIE